MPTHNQRSDGFPGATKYCRFFIDFRIAASAFVHRGCSAGHFESNGEAIATPVRSFLITAHISFTGLFGVRSDAIQCRTTVASWPDLIIVEISKSDTNFQPNILTVANIFESAFGSTAQILLAQHFSAQLIIHHPGMVGMAFANFS